jgi:hypothetical protein
MYAYLYVQVTTRQMLIEEVLDGIERSKKELSYGMTPTTERDTQKNKKNREISSY